MAYLVPRNAVNYSSLFGTYSIAQNAVAPDLTGITNDNLYNYVIRDPKMGELEHEIDLAKIKLDMNLDPVAYINAKRADLISNTKILRKLFKKKFALYLSNGYTDKQAQAEAMRHVKTEEQHLNQLHKRKFPKEIDQLKIDNKIF